ncbi:5-amino-6-(5-phosphoribosylamino)uracil reductase [Helicobacter pylori]|uniref:5-amino-6-(5-phosphoribosylamino)uracil reductase n=1 Tax=Helicobacter pylori TaxID=210 RepID=UPI000FDD9177|nr:5-amino-6-(5-phosphoribosylamino)uracil reductase [Helicobacter pylori]RVY66266.1 5-amino-6-(5-phosphoribosylamino)uracil reductase [Helicobacter pylori]
MAEWKTDTEEVKEIVRKCREFKERLQKERCLQFITNLDSYALKIIVECRKIEMQLQNAREELKKAKSNEDDAKVALRVLQGASVVLWIWPPARIAAAAAIATAEIVLRRMKEYTEKCKRNVGLLERMLEIYSNQAKASVELVKGAWESVKKMLHFYTDKHQEFIKRLNQASDAIDNEYNFPTPGVLMEYDFERPKIAYSPKKSVFDEHLKDLREDFSFSLYADLKNRFNASSKSDRTKASKEHGLDLMSGTHSFDESLTLAKKNCVKNCKKALEGFAEKIKEAPNDPNAVNEAFDSLETELERATENLSQKIDPVLERNEDYTQKALEYRELLESRKEGFIVDEKNPYPEEVSFNEWRLAEFDSVFSAIVPLEDLNKTACAHHALKALQAALKDNDLGFDANVLGNVALVREELLLGVKHTKGYSLWTEFLQKQN